MKLLPYLKEVKVRFTCVSLLIILNAGLFTLAGLSSANALSAISKLKGDIFFYWVMAMGATYLFYAILSYIISIQQTRLEQDLDKAIRRDIANKLAQTNYSTFHQKSVSTYSSWLTNDITTINEYGIGDFMMIVRQISEIIMGAFSLAYFNFGLVVSVALLTILMAIVPNLFAKLLSKRSLTYTQANERLVNSINNILNGFNTLFLVNLPQTIVAKINEASDDVKIHSVNYSKAANMTQWITNGLAFISQVIILGQTGWLILHGMTAVGAISGTQFFASTIFAELSGISFNWQEFKSLDSVFNKFAQIKVQKNNGNKQKINNGNINLENISYAYPDQEKRVLNNLNYTFYQGRKYLITGNSATGKSTILNLISGLLRNYKGSLKLGKNEYHSISNFQLHKEIAYLEQDPYIFADTLRWNLTLGQKISSQQLQTVIKECGLQTIIDKLPQGLDSKLSPRGSNLSGGQKQRIAFARALLLDRPIYLIDEATSALDKVASIELERLILEKQNKTVIMVTHHLHHETQQLADQVVNIENL